MNNKYEIEIGQPLVRPGLTIRTEASEKYLVRSVQTLMEKVRELNKKNEEDSEEEKEEVVQNKNLLID